MVISWIMRFSRRLDQVHFQMCILDKEIPMKWWSYSNTYAMGEWRSSTRKSVFSKQWEEHNILFNYWMSSEVMMKPHSYFPMKHNKASPRNKDKELIWRNTSINCSMFSMKLIVGELCIEILREAIYSLIKKKSF